ncbi:MAG: formyltransferase family protein [Armatimonadota bacterium]
MRILVITSNQRRHAYVASQLSKSLDVVGVVSESKSPGSNGAELDAEDQAAISEHFRERDAVETALLGSVIDWPDTPMLTPDAGGVNSPRVAEWVYTKDPDFVVLYGSSIVEDPLLSHYHGRIINIHLGLSPYYRGSGTNFWPLVHRRPECVGATIHIAVPEVDAGGILAQVRPGAEVQDRAHELGTKTIVAATNLLPQVIWGYACGQVHPVRQDLSTGRVFRTRDFNAGALRTMWGHFGSGMVKEYLDQQEQRHAHTPIIELAGNPGL